MGGQRFRTQVSSPAEQDEARLTHNSAGIVLRPRPNCASATRGLSGWINPAAGHRDWRIYHHRDPRLQLFGDREKWLSGGCEPNPAGRVYWRWSLRDKVIVQCNKETPWR